MIEIKHLQLLAAVDRYGSLSAAARALGCSQPALTQQVRALERLMRTPLLIRTASGAGLTEAGQVMLRHGTEILDRISLAEAEVAAVAALETGQVRVVAFPSAAATIVPSAMAYMRREFPDIRITMTEAAPSEAVQQLRRGECELVVTFRYSTEPECPRSDLVHFPLLSEHVQLALPPEHPAAREAPATPVDLARLMDARWIGCGPRCCRHLLSMCQATGFTPDIVLETDDYIAVQALAARGLGAALMTDLMLGVVTLNGLNLRPITPATTRRVSAISTRGLARLPAVQATVRAFERSAASFGRAALVSAARPRDLV